MASSKFSAEKMENTWMQSKGHSDISMATFHKFHPYTFNHVTYSLPLPLFKRYKINCVSQANLQRFRSLCAQTGYLSFRLDPVNTEILWVSHDQQSWRSCQLMLLISPTLEVNTSMQTYTINSYKLFHRHRRGLYTHHGDPDT